MLWRGRRQSDNIEDARGQGGGGCRAASAAIAVRFAFRSAAARAAAVGIGGIIILVILFFVLRACGIDPMQILNGGSGPAAGAAAR